MWVVPREPQFYTGRDTPQKLSLNRHMALADIWESTRRVLEVIECASLRLSHGHALSGVSEARGEFWYTASMY